jgi:hypothetical protein
MWRIDPAHHAFHSRLRGHARPALRDSAVCPSALVSPRAWPSQLMDPQMDSGMERPAGDAQASAIPDAWDPEELRPRWRRALSPAETLGSMDELARNLNLYLRGHALAQTVFQCAWAHDPNAVGCSLLRIYVTAILRLADVAHVVVVRGNVCEEEDFTLTTASLSLAEGVSHLALLAMLDEAEGVLAERLSKLDSGTAEQGALSQPLPAGWELVAQASAATLRALRCRLLLVRSLYALLQPLRKHTLKNPSALGSESADAAASALEQLELVRASLADGSPASVLAFAFSDACCAHVRGTAPQRILPPVTRSDACDSLSELVTQLSRIPPLLEAQSLDELLLGYGDLCARTRLQPLARTALRILVLCAHEADTSSSRSLTALIEGALARYHFALQPDALRKLLARPAVRSALERCAHGVLVHLQIYCHNDVRRRRKLGASRGARAAPPLVIPLRRRQLPPPPPLQKPHRHANLRRARARPRASPARRQATPRVGGRAARDRGVRPGAAAGRRSAARAVAPLHLVLRAHHRDRRGARVPRLPP